MVPVVATFATAEPFIIPSIALAMTATFAGPPGDLPTTERDRSFMKLENPLCLRKAPKTTNRKM